MEPECESKKRKRTESRTNKRTRVDGSWRSFSLQTPPSVKKGKDPPPLPLSTGRWQIVDVLPKDTTSYATNTHTHTLTQTWHQIVSKNTVQPQTHAVTHTHTCAGVSLQIKSKAGHTHEGSATCQLAPSAESAQKRDLNITANEADCITSCWKEELGRTESLWWPRHSHSPHVANHRFLFRTCGIKHFKSGVVQGDSGFHSRVFECVSVPFSV